MFDATPFGITPFSTSASSKSRHFGVWGPAPPRRGEIADTGLQSVEEAQQHNTDIPGRKISDVVVQGRGGLGCRLPLCWLAARRSHNVLVIGTNVELPLDGLHGPWVGIELGLETGQLELAITSDERTQRLAEHPDDGADEHRPERCRRGADDIGPLRWGPGREHGRTLGRRPDG